MPMPMPDWDDQSQVRGTMVRTALWLIARVGVGNIFTKEQHREAFRGVAQADRRLRDLRQFGWVIHTNREDVALRPNEQRLVKIGAAVWERSARTASKGRLSAKERMRVLAHGNFQCSTCGIAGGESYPDNPTKSAVLTLSQRCFERVDGRCEERWMVECSVCRDGVGSAVTDLTDIRRLMASLSDTDRERLAEWQGHGRRGELEKAWIAYRRLPDDLRSEFDLSKG